MKYRNRYHRLHNPYGCHYRGKGFYDWVLFFKIEIREIIKQIIGTWTL